MKLLSHPRKSALALLAVTLVLIAIAARYITDRTTFLIVLGCIVVAHMIAKMRLLKHQLHKEHHKK